MIMEYKPIQPELNRNIGGDYILRFLGVNSNTITYAAIALAMASFKSISPLLS